MDGPNGSTDPMYDKPFVDIDEWRDEPARHRYVHGGFHGTDLRFSIYFPPPERYEGRFFQPLMAVSGTEHAATMPPMMGAMIGNLIPFAADSGAYLVESNQGRTVMYPGDDPTIPGYGQVVVPPTAAARKGVQPVVAMTANGGERAEVSAGENVAFDARIDMPPGAGLVVAANWDFEGAGDFPVSASLDFAAADGSSVIVRANYAFAAPGTYFPALRATSQRQGNSATRFGRIQNLGRVRVVVR